MNSAIYLHGGEVVGQGGNGCVLTTPISDIVEKVGSAAGITEEYSISTVLLSLDPNQKYGLYPLPPLVCNDRKHYLDELNQSNLKREGKCKAIKTILMNKRLDNSESFCSYTMKRFLCDISIPNLEKIKISNKQYIRNLMMLWEGLAFFHKNNIVHSDIKNENIAFKDDGTFAYFDWGWSKDISTNSAALTHLKTMRNTEFRYIPSFFKQGSEDENIDGIWSPTIYSNEIAYMLKDATAYGSKVKDLLKFNDVYSLALAQRDHVMYMIDDGRLGETKAIREFLKKVDLIFLEKIKFTDQASALRDCKNLLFKVLESV